MIARAALPIALAMVTLGAAATAQAKGSEGLRFDSPGVLDLAERSQKVVGAAISTGVLAPAEAEKILAAPTFSEEQPSLAFSDDVFACKKPSRACSLEHESKLIAASNAAIKRDDKRLMIVTASGAPAVFIDWKIPESRTADGDEETHWYLGRMPGGGYHRVEVQFGHDAPGNFLVNPANGKMAFVHNGADLVAPAPDGLHLLTFITLNPPLSVRLAALDAVGPSLELQCEVGKDNERVSGQFKGWHDARSFDLVLQIPAMHSAPARVFAMRLTWHDATWTIAAAEPGRLAAIGFACYAATAKP